MSENIELITPSEITTLLESTLLTTPLQRTSSTPNDCNTIMPISLSVYSSQHILGLVKEIMSDVKLRPYIVGAVCVVGVIVAYILYKKRTAALNNRNPNGGDDIADDFWGNWHDGNLEMFDDSNDHGSSDDEGAIHDIVATSWRRFSIQYYCYYWRRVPIPVEVFGSDSSNDEIQNVAIPGRGFQFLVQVAIPVAPTFKVFMALTKFEGFTAPPYSPNNSKNLPLTAALLKFIDAMNKERLMKMAGAVRTGGKGTVRRKKKAVHKTGTTDDKRLQSTLKRVGVNTIPAIEEVNIFKDDLVIQFVNPKVQASIAANTWVVSGSPQTKKLQDVLPGIINQLGPDNMEHLKRIAEEMQKQVAAAGATAQAKEENDDDVPELVPGENFEEVAQETKA
ncbi:hypothetical protein OsI_14347 [Oryza sativa Indica Group]|nr:hypothetical protein OsI_14347 [Oryza sativa Indica Group]